MRLLLALALASAIGCSDSLDPVKTAPLEGTYRLTAIDDNALPHTVTIDDEPTTVSFGHLELSAPALVAVSLTLGPSGSSDIRSIAIADFYRRVTADSVVFPAIAPPELFLRRTGTTVILITEPAGSVFGAAGAGRCASLHVRRGAVIPDRRLDFDGGRVS